MKNIVGIETTKKTYPEFPYNDKKLEQDVLQTLADIGLDKKNPFKKLVFDGAHVVLKPNLVFHQNHNDFPFESLVAHTSIIKIFIDLLIKTQKNITISIIDVPLQTARWDIIMKHSKLPELLRKYRDEQNINIELIDGRKERSYSDKFGNVFRRVQFNGDPRGFAAVQVGTESELMPISNQFKRFSVTGYEMDKMSNHHNKNKHEYLICKTVLNSDLFINIPKLKTHKKGGITVSLKNLVGINASKDWLPHHREGSVEEGGDEYPHKKIQNKFFSKTVSFLKLRIPLLANILARIYYSIKPKKDIRKLKYNPYAIVEGSWHGNDTLWRTILDINKIILYADKEGVLQKKQQRKYLSFVDGVIGMEREGPLHGNSKPAGVLIAGYNPAAVDIISARVMGFDERKIPQLQGIANASRYLGAKSIKQITIKSKDKKWIKLKNKPEEVSLGFIPHSGWKGHIEWSTK